ncbi:hypothetical protein CRE_08460 [Caenorhabditis remanei]|uniref:TIMELESS-interacting protein n=1 Tax=Caenorhabditis remanei TaxID=31234 RepID=E3N008_CAERE|nr:hypothetical protein CRE_08460 [Caenorhabditis remanei]
MDEMDDFFGNDDMDRESSPIGDEAIEDNRGEESKKKIIEPKLLRTKKLTNPRLALNESTLTGPKGISALKDTFKNFKPNPKDDPYTNLDKLMKKYAYWGHLMFPKMKTEDVLSRVETLGTRRQLKVYLMKQRLGESTDELENDEKSGRKIGGKGIIDDGAEDDEEAEPNDYLFDDLPGEESPQNSKKLVDSPKKPAIHVDHGDEEEEFRLAEEQRLRELEEAAADEIMEDFDDMNNDW